MTDEQAAALIERYGYGSGAPGLSRIRALMEMLGHPERRLRYVHLAGTNGKGSTSACVAAVLEQAGYRTGLFTSPHINSYCERFRVDGVDILPQELGELATQVGRAAEQMAEQPTAFEVMMAIGTLHFVAKNCDIVVLEVGMGGEFDPTNVIAAPEVAVITALGLDHVSFLGSTIAEIAATKSGIIKAGCDVVHYGLPAESVPIVREKCAQEGARYIPVDFGRLHDLQLGLEGSRFRVDGCGTIALPLLGVYQSRNALTAITVLETLAERGWRISAEDIRIGLSKAVWRGRFELLRRAPIFLLDGAHNLQGMESAVESLRAYFAEGGLTILLGAMADKEVEKMVTLLLPLTREFITVTAPNERAMSASALAQIIEHMGGSAQPAESINAAVAAAVVAAGEDGAVCALGTLYFSGEVRSALNALR